MLHTPSHNPTVEVCLDKCAHLWRFKVERPLSLLLVVDVVPRARVAPRCQLGVRRVREQSVGRQQDRRLRVQTPDDVPGKRVRITKPWLF